MKYGISSSNAKVCMFNRDIDIDATITSSNIYGVRKVNETQEERSNATPYEITTKYK